MPVRAYTVIKNRGGEPHKRRNGHNATKETGDIMSKYNDNALVAIRTARGLTQQQLANAAGLNIRMIQKFESGERSLKTARADTLMAIAGALGVKIEKLLKE
jgi:DNA-binding transcriptional regulator YiaG